MHCLISYGLMPASGNDRKPQIGILRLELRSLGDWLAEYFLGAVGIKALVGITIFRTISLDSGKLYC